jgi:beta-xylosidase
MNPIRRTAAVFAPIASVLIAAVCAAAEPIAPWVADRGDGTYRNPILFADYSDPDVVRVGDDYWLTASSFSHVPGLPVLHSRDLVNWTIVNHALPALAYPTPLEPSGNVAEHFSVPRHGAGVWAPAIRHHAGKFWIYFPDPDYGIYVTTATDPRGTWSAPQLVKGGKGLIDPCPLWDDDGRLYLVHGWAKSRSGKNNLLTLNALSTDGTQVTDGDGAVIIDENTTGRGLGTLEGPKFYKHAGEYWIFAPVGGVTSGTQAVYRAKNVGGPYTLRIVLAQGGTAINGPHQGGWVDTPAGENWFVHFQDRGAYGRITHLEPMSWRADGWPAMGTAVKSGAEIGEPVLTYKKPSTGAAALSPQLAAPATTDEFDRPQLGLQWQWQANPRPEWSSLVAKPGSLRLFAWSSATLYSAPNLLLQKFPAPEFTVTTRLDGRGLDQSSVGANAGLAVFGYDYAWIGLTRTAAGLRVEHVINHQADKQGTESVVANGPVLTSSAVVLRVVVDAAAQCQFAFSEDGVTFTELGGKFHASVGRWVGAKVGLFARSAPILGAPEFGHADFDWFRVTR